MEKWPAKAKLMAAIRGLLAVKGRRKEKLMKERERKWGLYKGMEMNIIMLPLLMKETLRLLPIKIAASPKVESASRQKGARRGNKSRVQE